jgi:hypothetical protein
MGFDGLFFGRADYQDFEQRNATKTMEMIWKGSANLGENIYKYSHIHISHRLKPMGEVYPAQKQKKACLDSSIRICSRTDSC